MSSKKNTIAIILSFIGILEMIIGFFAGIYYHETNESEYYYIAAMNWSFTVLVWLGSFISGMFFIGLAEIIEQLHQLNLKCSNKSSDEDDLELLDKDN